MRTKLHPMRLGIGVIGALVMLVSVAGAAPSGTQATQTDAQGGITVKAVYITAAYLKAAPRDPLAGKVDVERNIVFSITLDTHAGDLSTYDFLKNVVLRNDRGQQVTPVRWVSTADGSHHRAGGLVFPRADQAGRAIDTQARALELVVRSLGAPERVLRWSLPVE
jgi:hypothetical protein